MGLSLTNLSKILVRPSYNGNHLIQVQLPFEIGEGERDREEESKNQIKNVRECQ